MSGDAIRIEGLSKSFRDAQALRGLTLNVPRGSICALLGRNGAGKTTTLKIMLGMLRKDAGVVEVLGRDAATAAGSLEIRRRVGFASENKELYPLLTVRETIAMVRGFFPHWRADLEQRYLDRFELPPDRKTGKLSRGMHTKLMLLLALARGAELLVLDEPTGGLDPAVSEEVLQAIVSVTADQGTTAFFASHNLAEVEQIADRVCIIEGGRTVLCEQLDELRAGCRMVQAVFEGGVPGSLQVSGAARMQRNGRSVSMLLTGDVDAAAQELRAQGACAVDVRPVSLKEIFLHSVKGERA